MEKMLFFLVLFISFTSCEIFVPFEEVISVAEVPENFPDSLRLMISSPSGLNFVDQSDYGNTVTVNGYDIIVGDGVINTNLTSHISGDGSGSLSVSNIGIDTFRNLTFSFWMKSYSGKCPVWLSKGNLNTDGNKLKIDYGRLNFGQVIDPNNSNNGPNVDELFLNGEWTMVTLVANDINNRTTGEVEIFRDGVLVDVISSTGILFEENSDLVFFQNFYGLIDNIRLYDYSLTSEEIARIYVEERLDFPERDWSDIVVPEGLLLYFNFNDFPIVDLKERTGILNPPALTNLVQNSPDGQSLSYSFEEESDTFGLSITPFFELSSFTIVCWLLPDLPLSDFTLFTDNKSVKSELSYDSAAGRFQFGAFGENRTLSFNPEFRLASGDWTMVTFTASRINIGGPGHKVEFYLNDNEDPVATASNADVDFTRNGWFTIGTNYLSDKFYTGLIDNVRIYNRVLTSDEIVKIYDDED